MRSPTTKKQDAFDSSSSLSKEKRKRRAAWVCAFRFSLLDGWMHCWDPLAGAAAGG